MAKSLTGKSAVVTGSGDGIGKAIAMALAAEGAKVVVNDIAKAEDGTKKADAVVAEIKKAGGAAVANYDTVATMEGGRNITKAAVSNFGRIDILVNNAGNYRAGLVAEQKEEDWDSVIAVHLKGTFACIQPAVKEMTKQKFGRIVNIGSNAGFHFASPGCKSISYAAAKAGIMGITASMSANLKPDGITVNCILPGAITQLFPYLTRGGFGAKQRSGPEFVAPTIVYLCTDEAKDVTGQYFGAQGGEIILYNKPFQMPGPHLFVRKIGMWTVDELKDVIPSMLGQ